MHRNEIEEKDRRTVKKIRAIVKQKERQAIHQTAFWKKTGVWLPALCIGLVVIGLAAFNRPSPTAVQDTPGHPPTMVAVTEKAAPLVEGDDQAMEPEVQADTENEALAVDMRPPADGPAVEETSDLATPPLPSPAEAKVSDDAVADADIDAAAAETTADATAPSKPGSSSGVHISHLITCGNVHEKQFVSPKSEFSLAADPFVMVWMRVLSKTPPLTLKHVYSVNGKHYCDVPLQIPYPHMRTWSKVTIDRDIHLGQWHVDVVDENGDILDQIEFTVGP